MWLFVLFFRKEAALQHREVCLFLFFFTLLLLSSTIWKEGLLHIAMCFVVIFFLWKQRAIIEFNYDSYFLFQAAQRVTTFAQGGTASDVAALQAEVEVSSKHL